MCSVTRISAYTLLVTSIALVLLAARPSAAAEPAAASLELAPQDAAFYAATLRVREQIEIVAESNWWRRLNESDVVQQIRVFVEANLEGDREFQKFLRALEQPENQQLIEVLKDMASEEMFCYADRQASGTLALLTDVNGAARVANVLDAVGSGFGSDETQLKAALDAAAADLDNVAVPAMVLGSKLSKTESANEQLQRLEAFVRVALEQFPELRPLKGNFERTKVGDNDFLSLTLDAGLLPWDDVPFADLESEKGQYEKLEKKLRGLQAVVSIGIFKDYVLLSIGPSNEHLDKLGQGKSLAGHPQLAPLRAASGKRITSIQYVSDQCMQALSVKPADIDELAETVKELVPLAGLPEEAETQVRADIGELADDVKPCIGKAGPQLAFSLLTEQGVEAFRYNWSENRLLDGSKPLPILNHLGGNPIFAAAARCVHRPEDYDMLVKWLSKAKTYHEKFIVPEYSDDARERYEQFAKIADPLLKRADEVNRKMLIPAMADGEIALVVDGKVKTTQWFEQQPPTTEAIALPSPAIVCGVKDAALLKKALGEYRDIANKLLGALHEINPEEVPKLELPEAQVESLKSGAKVYFYQLPPDLGVYEMVAPNVAISDKLAVFSLIPRHTVALAKTTPIDATGRLAGTDRPLAAASHFDWNAMVDMIAPWVHEGARYYVRQLQAAFGGLEPGGDLDADGADPAEAILEQVRQVTKFLKVCRGYSSVTYVENGALVTHSEMRFKDIGEE